MKSRKQYENQIRLIVVAETIKEFKKSAIIKSIVDNAKSLKLIASERLINPSWSKSITPTADDRWLIPGKRKAVIVRVYNTKAGIPSTIKIVTQITGGYVDRRYYQLTDESKGKKFGVSEEGVERIKNWIKLKANRGNTWRLKIGKKVRVADMNKPSDVQKLAFFIARKIRKRGIASTGFTNPFKDKRTGITPTLDRAEIRINKRLTDLFTDETVINVDRLMLRI